MMMAGNHHSREVVVAELWIHQLFLPAVVVHRLKSPHTSHKGLTLSCQVKNLLLLGQHWSEQLQILHGSAG